MRRRLALPFVLPLVSALLFGLPPQAAEAGGAIRARQVVGGLDAPVAFTFAPDGTLWYVEKTNGEIHVHDLGTDADSVFFRVPGVNGQGERGMLGIALDPSFPSDPYVYVYVTRSVNGHLRNQIVRLTDANGSGGHLRVIFSSPASSEAYHNGGRILFGPDGMLYAIVGDGHDSSNAQDLSNDDRGKILRMTPTGGVPTTNPRRSRMWAYGIRNSFGFAFDPRNGRLWETENGPECNDEINLIRKGSNYGWGQHETCSGAAPRDTNQDGPRPVLPKRFFANTIAITGIAFCHDCGLGSANEGSAFFGAYNTGEIDRLTLDARRTGVRRITTVLSHGSATLSLETAPDGTIYFSDLSGIYRLVRR